LTNTLRKQFTNINSNATSHITLDVSNIRLMKVAEHKWYGRTWHINTHITKDRITNTLTIKHPHRHTHTHTHTHKTVAEEAIHICSKSVREGVNAMKHQSATRASTKNSLGVDQAEPKKSITQQELRAKPTKDDNLTQCTNTHSQKAGRTQQNALAYATQRPAPTNYSSLDVFVSKSDMVSFQHGCD
jgi:hypothetical protein